MFDTKIFMDVPTVTDEIKKMSGKYEDRIYRDVNAGTLNITDHRDLIVKNLKMKL